MQRLLGVPNHIRKRIVSGLETGSLKPPYSPASLKALGMNEYSQEISTVLCDLSGMGVSNKGLAGWLRSLESVAFLHNRPDFVWSGPEVEGLHARDTRRVFEELISTANNSIWISTFAFFDGHKAFELLASRMDRQPDLRVFLILNIQRKYGDATPAEQLVRRFADSFWKTEWPGTARPLVYFDPRSLEMDGPKGVLHAKALVADDEAVFITSANMTEAAFDRNIEMGVLVRDRAFAVTVVSHFRVLKRNHLHLLPCD